MSLRDPKRVAEAFELDDVVKSALAQWSRERDSELGRLNLRRAFTRMGDRQKAKLVERLAEISLGLLFAIKASKASSSESVEDDGR